MRFGALEPRAAARKTSVAALALSPTRSEPARGVAWSHAGTAAQTSAIVPNSETSADKRVVALLARQVGHASNRSIARLARGTSGRHLLRQVPPVASVRSLQRMAGNRATRALLLRSEDEPPPTKDQLREQARKEIKELEGQLDDAVRKAENRLGELGSRPPPPSTPVPEPGPYGEPISDRDRQKAGRTPVQPGSKKDMAQRRGWVEHELRRVARGGGPHAAEAQGILNDLAQRQKEIRERVIDSRAHYKPYGPKPPPPKPKPATPEKPGGKVDKPPAKPPPAPAKPRPAPAKPPPAPAPKAPHVPSGTTAGKVAGEVVEEVGSKGRVWGRVAAKIGIAIVDGLVPDPSDAIALMIKYAESFKAAQEAVRKRNLEKGFAVGWACYLLFPRWERARTFARTEVSKDVITQIIDAVGIAENAYNEGLVRGFIYGEKHSRVQLNGARQRALDAVHLSRRTVYGDYLGDGVYQFVRDDVYLFAGTLLPASRRVIEEAEARKELRELIEDLQRRREQIERDYEIDMARK